MTNCTIVNCLVAEAPADKQRKGVKFEMTGKLAVQPGIVGICEVAREAYPDSTALDPDSKKYDPKATAEDPRWYMVDVKMVRPVSCFLIAFDSSTKTKASVCVFTNWWLLKFFACIYLWRSAVQPSAHISSVCSTPKQQPQIATNMWISAIVIVHSVKGMFAIV